MDRAGGTALAVAALLATAWPARAADEALARRVQELETKVQYVQDLEQEIELLKRRVEVKEEAEAAKGPQPQIGAGPDGFYLQSADKAFVLKLRGYTQLDSRWFAGESDDATSDSFVFRRVRPIVEGTLANWIDFRIMPDFANSTLVLQDAHANLRPFGTEAQLLAGKFKAPFGLERLQSATALTFIERALPTNLVPNRDLGVQLWGDFGGGLFTYQLAAANGVVDGGSAESDVSDAKDVVARIFTQPFVDSTIEPLQGLGVGFAASWGRERKLPPSYRTAGQNTFFSYASGTNLDQDRFRFSPQAYYYWGPFGAMFEYVASNSHVTLNGQDGDADATSWQISASYVLTGENASYRGVTPRSSFDGKGGGWGAWEIAARYSALAVDDEVFDDGFADITRSAKEARELDFGVNWYANRWLKLVLNYDRTWFDGGASGDDDRDTENLIATRLQLAY